MSTYRRRYGFQYARWFHVTYTIQGLHYNGVCREREPVGHYQEGQPHRRRPVSEMVYGARQRHRVLS